MFYVYIFDSTFPEPQRPILVSDSLDICIDYADRFILSRTNTSTLLYNNLALDGYVVTDKPVYSVRDEDSEYILVVCEINTPFIPDTQYTYTKRGTDNCVFRSYGDSGRMFVLDNTNISVTETTIEPLLFK